LKFESYAFENKGADLADPVAGDKPAEEEK